ncbi:DoxX family protein [Algoriphagus litoralis]|uniref:DoxX family protein n=1 Tax=Algoriphagus litoralis TaxID=2202829 RepID=UPI000DB9A517|nr:DoxX family protein [Algoriphagus litoralis]
MSQKTIKIIAWVLTGILALLFTMSAFMKLSQNEIALAQAASFGMDPNTFLVIGIIEIASLILFIFPRTGILGSLLLIAYMGGAIVTHLLHQEPIGMAVAVQILLWITAILRFPELKQRLFSSGN